MIKKKLFIIEVDFQYNIHEDTLVILLDLNFFVGL
jgi:hypothetical protein